MTVAFGTSTPTSITVVLIKALGFPATKSLHDLLFLRRGNAAMQQLAAKRTQPLPPAFELRRRRFDIELLALVDQRINDVGLPPGFQLLAQETPAPRRVSCSSRTAVMIFPRFARHLIDDRHIEIAVNGHGQRARNRRRGHDQHVRRGFALPSGAPAAPRRTCAARRSRPARDLQTKPIRKAKRASR